MDEGDQRSCRRGGLGTLILLHQVYLRALKMTNPPKNTKKVKMVKAYEKILGKLNVCSS